MSKVVKQETEEPTFLKSDLVLSKKYRFQKDVLNALLDNVSKYTIKEVDEKIENFMKGENK